MTGKIQDVIGRNFAVGFFLPAAVFAFYTVIQLHVYDIVTLEVLWNIAIDEQNPLVGVFLFFVVWLVAISLLAANNWIIRRKEGYGLPHGLVWWQRKKLKLLLDALRDRESNGVDSRPIRQQLASSFAYHKDLLDHERLLLPTTFGNIVRAFEAYPRVMYGFEATRGWARLLAVIPKDYRQIIEGVKAELDFLVNIWALSWLFILEYFVLAWISDWTFASAWFPVGACLSAWLASYWSRGAALRWGEIVKGAFDLYLPELRRQLELPETTSREAAAALWNRFSEAFLFRDPDKLP